MAQVGIHALIGLTVGEQIQRRFGSEWFSQSLAWGFLLGSIAPDLDVIAVAAALPYDMDLALLLHRSFTHSMGTVGAILVVSTLLSWVLHDRSIRGWGYGAALGVGLHIVMDLLFWFTPVDLLWPASALGWAGAVDLWAWWETPLLLGRLLAAGEFAAMGLYFAVLTARASTGKLPAARIASGRRLTRLSFGYSLVLAVLSFGLPYESEGLYRLLLLLPMALVTLPASLYLTWAVRRALLLSDRLAPFPLSGDNGSIVDKEGGRLGSNLATYPHTPGDSLRLG
ncbi:MAG: metal-dependent hydrolase [Bacillota bacterium]